MYSALCADYYETLAPTGLDKNTFACFCMRPALPGELHEIFALPGVLYENLALITFSTMSAFVVKMMYKVYKILCLYGISGVLSIEAMVEVRVRLGYTMAICLVLQHQVSPQTMQLFTRL